LNNGRFPPPLNGRHEFRLLVLVRASFNHFSFSFCLIFPPLKTRRANYFGMETPLAQPAFPLDFWIFPFFMRRGAIPSSLQNMPLQALDRPFWGFFSSGCSFPLIWPSLASQVCAGASFSARLICLTLRCQKRHSLVFPVPFFFRPRIFFTNFARTHIHRSLLLLPQTQSKWRWEILFLAKLPSQSFPIVMVFPRFFEKFFSATSADFPRSSLLRPSPIAKEMSCFRVGDESFAQLPPPGLESLFPPPMSASYFSFWSWRVPPGALHDPSFPGAAFNFSHTKTISPFSANFRSKLSGL